MFRGSELLFQLTLTVTLQNTNDRDDDHNAYGGALKASSDLLSKRDRAAAQFDVQKKAKAKLADLERQLRELPHALDSLEGQILQGQLNSVEGGDAIVNMVQNTINAHLKGSYIALLGDVK